MKQVIFLADFFDTDVVGGAELNDSVLIAGLTSRGVNVVKLKTSDLTDEDVIKNDLFIVSNFVNLSERHKNMMMLKKYIIYEHDHKYITTRDPSKFAKFNVPKSEIINKEFYEKAHRVVVLSKICKEILEKTLDINNVDSIGCSLWTDAKLDYIESICETPKTKENFIINSQNPIKGTRQAAQFCKQKSLQFDLIGPSPHEELLKQMSEFNSFTFAPQVLETMSRVVVESKMLGCKVFTNRSLIGACYEDWYSLNGRDLIDKMRQKKAVAIDLFHNLLREENMKFVSYKKFDRMIDDLTMKILKSYQKIDAVVPVLRSGMIPAFKVAQKLNVPIMVDGVCYGGERISNPSIVKKVLIIDDSISSGRAMISEVKKYEKYEKLTAAVIARSNSSNLLDFYSSVIDGPRMFEWNMFNNLNTSKVMFDMDGVLCIDPRVFDDDGESYENEIRSLPHLFLTKYPIHSICTNRIERWRPITEEWLSKNKVKYGKLIMQNFPTAVERRLRSNAGVYKAKHYSSSDAVLFVESSLWQAEKIFELTGKDVYCIENNRLYSKSGV
jgi:uncharacterized HAD superfamily protein/hypoxanthine phosphoribosyltransferase